MPRLLLVDDDPLSLESTRLLLESRGYQVTTAKNEAEAVQKFALEPDRYSLALIDYQMRSGRDGAAITEKLREICPSLYVLIYSGDPSREAVKATWEAGASGFVEKGGPTDTFLETIARWCRKHEETFATLFVSDENPVSELGMVGQSKPLQEVAAKVARYRDSEQNVLILGETGTGKELVARALHRPERGVFFAINCAAYKGGTDLLESELFGYERGAFTGADREKRGVLESASGGTVFLDEVHHLSLTAQAKLLRVLQERKIRRVGGVAEYAVRFRLVAAAKPDIETLCERGEFLRDFYHRLSVLPIELAPLRDRPEDIEPLVRFFCRKFQEATGKRRTFLLRTIRYLERYHWPGNVRELENTVYRLLTDATAEAVGPEALDAKFFSPSKESRALTYEELKKRHEKEERDHVLNALRSASSKVQAAERLGISPSTLHSIMKRVGLYSETSA